MKKASKVLSYRRQPQRRSPARICSNTKFIATVTVIATAAFMATMMWPRVSQSISAQAAAPAYDFACDVAYVNDGDTLRCRDGTRVRFHAIAARETDNSCSPGHPCPTASATESKAALTRLAGSRITCFQIGISYDRVTAICHNVSGVEINCAMVESGAASLWDRYHRNNPICRTE